MADGQPHSSPVTTCPVPLRPDATRRPAGRAMWPTVWAALLWPLFVTVSALTVSRWAVDPQYTETTPVGDLSFLVLGVMIAAGFTSEARRHPSPSGAVQSLLAASALAVCGLLGSRVEPLAGGALLIAAAAAQLLLHPRPRGLLRRPHVHGRALAGLALVAAVVGAWYAAAMITAALAAGPSCFLGQCVRGDRLAEMAATAVAIPALAALAAVHTDGWRLPLWSAGLGAITLGATSSLLPHAAGSLGLLGGVAAMAWGVLLVAVGERERIGTTTPPTRTRTMP